MAVPKSGSMLFIGISGKTYEVDTYFSDVANAKAQFDQGAGAGAGSGDYWRTPEKGYLRDISIVTGMGTVTKVVLILNGRRKEDTFRCDTHVSTSPQRPPINKPIDKGVDIGLIQLA